MEPLREWLGEWADAVGYHHERWDGKGYPRGIAGEEIPFAGRIVAIADVFDVITSARSYKEAGKRSGSARGDRTLLRDAVRPRLVRAFVNISLGSMRLIMGPVSWLTHAPLLARFPLTPSITAALGGLASLATAATTGLVATQQTARAASQRVAEPAPAAHIAPRAHTTHSVGAKRQTPPPQGRTHDPVAIVTPVATPHTGETAAAPATSSAPSSAPASPSAEFTPPAPAAAPAPPTPHAPAPAPQTPAPTPAAPAPTPPTPTPPPPTTPPTTPVVPAPPAPPPPPPRRLRLAAPTPTPTPPPPVVNNAPSFTAGSNQTLLEDGGAQSVAAWAANISAGPASESSQVVDFIVTDDNTGLFVAQPTITSGGTLTYTPAANANGVSTVTVAAHDDGGTANGGVDTSAPQTFTVTIVAVNDPPSFTADRTRVCSRFSARKPSRAGRPAPRPGRPTSRLRR